MCREGHGLQRPPLHKPLSSSSSTLMRHLREQPGGCKNSRTVAIEGARLEGFQIIFWLNFVPQEGSQWCSSATEISPCSEHLSGKQGLGEAGWV